MIIDKEECKRLVGETGFEHDGEIEALLPIVQDDLVDYCGHVFEDPLISYSVSEISFVKGSPDTITDNQSEFSDKRFAAGMDIFVDCGNTNRGIYELATVAAGTLTLTCSNELVSMAYDDSEYVPGSTRISKINWPRSLKLVAARMVWYLIARHKPEGELSKSIDGVTEAYDRTRSYPREIMQMADKYKLARFA